MFGSLLLTTLTPQWITLEAADWQGDTGSFTLGSGTATCNAVTKVIRTNDTLISASQDFDYEFACGAFSTSNGPVVGFADNGTNTGAPQPTLTNPVVSVRNGGGAPGWNNGDNVQEGAQSSGWMASHTIKISRRGSTFYGQIDGGSTYTYSGTTSSAAGKLFIGCAGGASGWSLSGIRYRAGAGLPTLP